MNLFIKRGRAGRAQESVRRRTRPAVSLTLESLEGRRLLAAGNLGLNVDITNFTSFVNLLQDQPSWVDAPGLSNPLVYNSSGDPESDASVYMDLRVNQAWNGPDPNAVAPNLSGTYNLSFNGEATVQPEYPGWSTAFTVQNQSYNPSTDTTTAQLVVPASNTSDFFGVSLLKTQATASSPVDSGFSNAKLIRPGYAANSTQLYTNEFLAALQPFTTLRYLNDDDANNQPFFNGNTLVTVNASQLDQTGMPWEYLVALANQSNTDMWINIPQGATNDYVTALAGVIKNGGTVGGVSYPGLNSNLKIYLEYSNEVWGGIPGNLWYQQAAVQNLAANQPLSTFSGNLDVYNNPDGTTGTDVYTAVGRRYLEETASIGQIFQSVLGSDPTHQRIRPVLGWQEHNFGYYEGSLPWFEHFFGPASASFYGMGDANYSNATDYSSASALLANLQSQEAAYAIPDTTDFTTLATYYGLANVAYEGGDSPGGNASDNTGQVALAAVRSPAMTQVFEQHYDDFFAAGGTLGMDFSGPYAILGPTNTFDEIELSNYGNPTASPRFQASVALSQQAPVADTAGTPLPATGTTTLNAVIDSLGNNLSSGNSGLQGYWLVDAASAGTYDLKLTTTSIAQSPGQVEVFVNDKQVGGLISVAAGTVTDLGYLSLAAGQNTISMLIVHGSNDPSHVDTHFYPSTLTLSTPGTVLVGDPSFEDFSIGAGNIFYGLVGTPWTFSTASSSGGSGLAAMSSGFTSGNPSPPQGSQVTFIQSKGTITQAVAGWPAGSYTIAFDGAQRGNQSNSAEDFEVLMDGAVVGTYKPTGSSYTPYTTAAFTVSAGTHTIEFLGLDSVGGDNTALIDAISVATVASTTGTAPPIGDPGFEALQVGSGNFAYSPAGTPWTFPAVSNGGSGLTANNSGFTAGNPSAPQGNQVAFLQSWGVISQAIAGWAAGSYTIAFDAAQRGNYATSGEDFEVLVDGTVVSTFKPTGKSYSVYTTAAFTVSAGTHTIEFLGLDSVGGDNTALIDAISVATAASSSTGSSPSLGDSGFEAIPVGSGNYAYNPTGSPWAFSAVPGGGSGLAANNSGFTAGNPSAPQGNQVAFLQGKGTITQAVSGWAAGSHTIAFDGAQRGNQSNSAEDFEVLIDGVVISTFKPTSKSYLAYSSVSFIVSAGTHTIEFLGLDSVGGDNTALIDAVSIS